MGVGDDDLVDMVGEVAGDVLPTNNVKIIRQELAS